MSNILVLSWNQMMLEHWDVIGWTIEQHLDALRPKLKPTFRKILDDIKGRKKIWKDRKDRSFL